MIRIEYAIGGERFSHELKEGNYIVGRSKSCDIVIRENSISGQHIRIDVAPDGVTFRDLLSRNGTILNGSKVTQGKLTPGCSLRLGHVDLVVLAEGAQMSSAITQGAAQAPAVSFSDLTDEELAPPPPPQSSAGYAVATIIPNSSAVEVFQLPDAVVPAENPAAGAAKKRIRLLATALVVAVAIVGGVMYQDWQKKQAAKNVKPVDNDASYWKSINAGVDEFRLGNYAAALKEWPSSDENYLKKTGKRLSVGRTFGQVAQVFQDIQSQGKVSINTDWSDLRRKMLAMINDNILSPELRDFAAEMENRCGKEQLAQSIIKETMELRNRREWARALARLKEIPPTSIYYSLIEQLNEQTLQQQLDTIRTDARNAATAGNFTTAISSAEEFFRLGGKDDPFAKDLASWRDQITIGKDMNTIRKAARDAITAQEIQNARQLAKNIKHRFPDQPRVLAEIPKILSELDERLYFVQLRDSYRTGNAAGLESLLKEGRDFQSNAEVQDLVRRFRVVSDAKRKADDAEGRGDLDSAMTQWKNIIATETEADNRYLQYAQTKMAQYPPETVGRKLMEEAVRAHNVRKYSQARELLSKAKNLGVDISEPLASLHKAGRVLFNQGVSSFLNKEYLRAYQEVNDALSCFSTEDEFYTTITNWMQKNGVDIRDK